MGALESVLSLVVTCSPIIGCNNAPKQMTLAERWPGQNPEQMRPDLIMVGDSIIEAWRYPGALNHGKGGQTSSDVEKYFDLDVLAFNPRAVLIGGGINDLRYGKSIDAIVQSRLNMARKAQGRGIKVYFGNVTPYDPSSPMCGPASNFAKIGGKAAQLNVVLSKICDTGLCTMLDMNAAIGGSFDGRLWSDCVHPNTEGNALFSAALAAILHAF